MTTETSGDSLLGYALVAGVVSLAFRPELPLVAFHQFVSLVDVIADTFHALG